MTSFDPPKLFKRPPLKKLTQLSNTSFSQLNFSQTFNTLSPNTSPPELNVFLSIDTPAYSPPKIYFTTRVHIIQLT